MPFNGKRILIVGMARSGMAAAQALYKRGAIVAAYDAKPPDALEQEMRILDSLSIPVFAGVLPSLTVQEWDMVIVSPGVPLDIEIIIEAYKLGIPVIGELELAYQLKSEQVKIYAITGTNGKTTTTALLHYILQQAGRRTGVGGNIGTALCSLVEDMTAGELVVEVSSFQLETIKAFRPHIAGVLNITPDHLDRHKTFEGYVKIKSRIFSQQKEEDCLVLNYEDERVRAFKDTATSRVVFFSTDTVLDQGVFVANGSIYVAEDGAQIKVASLKDIFLRGKHNLENILCAVAMAWNAGIREEVISKSLNSFKGVRHRLEQVAEHKGVLYINDSKGTNPDSTIKALESFEEPIILIAGGRPKGGDYTKVATLMAAKIKALLLLGEAKDIIKAAVMDQGFKNIYEVDDLVAAVNKASELATAGDVVLLSPACASWDQFPSYEHRGDLFCQQVKKIINQDRS